MYTPAFFKETNQRILFELIRKYNFGIFFSQHGEFPEATHLPFLLNEKKGQNGTLIAHFAKANKHWKSLNESKEVLTVFQGPHMYISPSWYKNRNTVPTWNYATVHVYGKPRVTDNVEELREMVTLLTHYHEKQIQSDWNLEEGQSSFETNLKGIIGLEIEIIKMEGTFKFNQNRSKEDQQKVIEHLTDTDAKRIMERNLENH